MKMLNDRRGVSPVITTVIIVAVGITIAIAVALWMTGLVGAFMGYEKIEIRSCYAAPATTGGGWTVKMTFNNTGSSPTKIDMIFINNVPIGDWNPAITITQGGPLPIVVNVGYGVSLTLSLPANAQASGMKLASGVTIEIKLHSTGGREYFSSVVLP